MSDLAQRKRLLLEQIAANRGALRLEAELLQERLRRLGRFFSFGRRTGGAFGLLLRGGKRSAWRTALGLGSLISSLIGTFKLLRRRRQQSREA